MRLDGSLQTLRRAANKLKREVLRRPPARYVWDMVYADPATWAWLFAQHR